uniref:Vitellogenin n=1 Tax=Cherax quadricarinatus TaxID=27406 RepID=Q9GSG2_CHEQU|nr:vitellogenin [Cherax quadricarinatus]
MTTSAALIVLPLVAGAGAPPFGGNTPVCSTECPIAGSPKLFYQPGKTYTYEYSGKSRIQLKGVEGGLTETDWSAQVELSWITPCDMVITMKDSKTDGATVPGASRFLERYPLVVAVTDGKVHHVCSHPDDDTWSINLKKGVASAFQNSLPSNSTINSGQNITETDVVGKCPTRYEVQDHGDTVIMIKEKNHRQCKERYHTPAENPAPWLRGPFITDESTCMCKQETRNGIYSAITCEDKNVVKPSYGAYKYVEAKMMSTLKYLSESSEHSSDILEGNMVRKSLLYDYHTPKKDPSMVTQLDRIMSQICRKTRDNVERDVAALVARAIQFLRMVPEEAVEQTLNKIRSGQYCQDYKKLEELFLDFVSFVDEPGAVKVMVKELLNSRFTRGRYSLYTAAFYLIPRPCIHAMKALKPLFESTRPMPYPTLAASSMVNNYCNHNRNCHEEEPVKSLAETLGNKLQRQCSASEDEQTVQAALTTLKALGNMGVMTPAVATSVLRCMGTEGADNRIRVAAAQAFRKAKCHRASTGRLVGYALDSRKTTEVRIASYIAAVRCAEKWDFEKIVEKISVGQNTQVRGFILSHLRNVQQSDAPDKENLRNLLTNIVIPRNFKTDIRKYSRNLDLSYFSPSAGVGAGLESNIIYAPGSFIPRSIDFNLTAALEGISMNIGEVGARFEGLDPFIEKLFGPESYFQKASYKQIFSEMTSLFHEKKNKFLEHFHGDFKHKRSIDMSTLSNFFHNLYSDESRLAKADVFARFMGQEISFASLAGDLTDISADRFIEAFFSYFNDIVDQMKHLNINSAHLNINSARTAQLHLDYYFPTIQGTPFKLKMDGTAVLGRQIEGNLNLVNMIANWKKGESILKLVPSLSVEVDGFVGYDCHISKTGPEMKNTISSSNGVSFMVRPKNNNELELELDIPAKMDFIDIESKIHFIKEVKGKPKTTVSVSPSSEDEVTHQSCSNSLESGIGIKLCYKFNFFDILRSNSFLQGTPFVAKLFLEKVDPSVKGYIVKTAIQGDSNRKLIKMKLEVPGATTARDVETVVSYTKEEDSYKISAELGFSDVSSKFGAHFTNKVNQKGVQAFAKYKSSDTEIFHAIKADIMARSTTEDMEYHVTMYVSRSEDFSPQSQVIEWKSSKKNNGPEISLDILAKTKNAWKSYIDLNLEGGVDLRYASHSRVPLPRKLRKFEFHTGLGGWKVISFVRQTSESGDKVEFSSAFKIARRNEDFISLEATHTTQGRLYTDFVCKTTAKVKMGRAEYKAASSIYYEHGKKGVSLQVIRSEDNVKVADLEATRVCTIQSCRIYAAMDMPGYMKVLKFECKEEEQGPGRYVVEAAIQHGDPVIFQAEGPVTAKISSDSAKLQTDIRFITISRQPFKLSSNFVFAKNKQVLSLELIKQREPVFVAEWNIKSGSSQGTTIGIKFQLPALVDKKLDAIISNKLIHVSFDTQFLPKSSAPRRIKAFTDIDFENKKWMADFAWDADRDQSKKIILDTNVISNPSNPGRVSIHGNVKCMNEMYHVKLDIEAENLRQYRYGENGFNLELTSPQRSLEWKLNTNVESRSAKVDMNLQCKFQDDREYRLTSVVDIEKLGSPYSYKLESEMSFTSPGGQETTVHAEAKHQVTSEEREIYYKASVRTPALRKPLVLEMSSVSQELSYSLKALTERDSPATMINWEMKLYPEGGVEKFVSSVDMNALRDFLKSALEIVAIEGEEYSSGSGKYGKGKYGFHYHKPTPSSYSMKIESPSRTLEGEAEYSPSRSSFKFYPDSDKSEAKYEITGESSHNYWDQVSKYEGRLSHPGMSKDIRVKVEHSYSGQTMRGSLELDIFPDTEDKITGTLKSTMIANNTVRIEASLTTRILRVHPKVTVMAAYSQNTTGIDVQFQKSPSSPVSFQVSALYDRIFTGDATMTFRVINEEDAVVDIAGVMGPEKDPECNGVNIKGVAYASPIGSYDIRSKLCRPFFFELISKKQESQKEFITKLGLQCPNRAEISLSESNLDQPWRNAIAMARDKLPSPTVAEVHFVYESENMHTVKGALKEDWQRVMESAHSWADSVSRYLEEQAQQQGTTFPNPEIETLLEEVKHDLREIYHDLIYKEIIPHYEAFREFLRRPPASYVIQFSSSILSGIAKIQRDLRSRLLHEVLAWQEEFKDITERIIELLVKATRWVETGEIPEPVRRLLEQLQETRIFRMFKRDVDAFIRRYPEEYEAIQEMVAKVKDTLQEDFENVLIRISKIKVVENTIKWILKDLSNENMIANKVEEYISEIIQEAIWALGVETNESEMKFKMHLHKPVYSLIQLLQEVHLTPIYYLEKLALVHDRLIPFPINNVIWAYYTLLPRHMTELLPPYNRTAMVVSDTEILTFDGALLRAPRSPCHVVLAVYANNKLTMTHPQPSAPPQITFSTGSTTVSVKPDFRVDVNGHEMNRQQLTAGDVFIQKTSREVNATSPFMTVRVFRQERVVSVNVSGWTYGRIAGLLGTYDGEVGNDWFTPSGRNASSLQELVASWQEDRQCPTPPISPFDHDTVPAERIIQCHSLLELRSKCFPVVNPKPFIKMCHAAHRPCDAAKAYRTMCARQGIRDMFPIPC